MYGLGARAEGLDIAASVVELRDQGFKGFRVWRGRPHPQIQFTSRPLTYWCLIEHGNCKGAYNNNQYRVPLCHYPTSTSRLKQIFSSVSVIESSPVQVLSFSATVWGHSTQDF